MSIYAKPIPIFKIGENVPDVTLPINLISIPNKVNDPNSFIDDIRNFIDITEEEEAIFYEKFKSKARYNRELVIKRNLNEQQIASFEVRKHNYPSLFVEKRYKNIKQ